MQHASSAKRVRAGPVSVRMQVSAGTMLFTVAGLGIAAILASSLVPGGSDAARLPAVELRPVPAPALSVMSVDLVAATRAEPVAILVPDAAGREAAAAAPGLAAEQVNLARFIAQRYRVVLADTERYVRYAFQVADELSLDPLLLLAVMSVESSFNPQARSGKGAKGLMQVLARVHTEKFAPYGGVDKAYDPLVNIRVGARILRDYIVRDGSVQAALKSYVGAALLPHDYGYGRKVLREHARLAAAASPNLAETTVPMVRLAAKRQPLPDASGTAQALLPQGSGLTVNHGSDAASAVPATPLEKESRGEALSL